MEWRDKIMDIIIFAAIGILSGAAMGFFGIAGGIIVVPGLMYFAGFSQKMAGGTNLLILLLPVSFAAAIEYYRAGNTSIKAAVIIAGAMCVSAWYCSHIAEKFNAEYLRLAFGIFVILMGIYISGTTLAKIIK